MSDEEFTCSDPLPESVACPTCHTTGLVIETTYRQPPDLPMEGGLTIRSPARPVLYTLNPCGHLIESWRWMREDDGSTTWTLVPRV